MKVILFFPELGKMIVHTKIFNSEIFFQRGLQLIETSCKFIYVESNIFTDICRSKKKKITESCIISRITGVVFKCFLHVIHDLKFVKGD